MTDKKSHSVWVVIPAAGSGQRMQSEIPKQYLEILDKSIIEHTLNCFLTHPQIAGVVVVISEDDQYWESLNSKSDIQVQAQVESKSKADTDASANQAPVFVVEINVKSDSTRSDSVMQGLDFLRDEHDVAEDSWVMIHDAARPCLSKSDIDALLGLRDTASVGGILASPVRDTMKRAAEFNPSTKISELSKTVSHTEPRANLWHALTPQMFQLGALSGALEHCKVEGIAITDECSAMENIGANPVIVEGSHNNIKVTYPSDLELATFLLSSKTSNKISTKH